MTKEENEKRLEYLRGIVRRLPDKPGSYQFYDDTHTIIYVGKAKNLKSRVSTYFHSEVDRFKTAVLVSKIYDISYTVVNTEEDALLLENSLIKKYNPRYNVLLKDGKTYPSICVTNEYFPRIFKTRTINKKWGSYYGPYSHIGTMYAVLDIIKELYHPRTCRQPITKEGIENKKYKVCLDFHIKKCLGPCVARQSYENYQKNILQAREILKGNTRQVLRDLKDEMLKLSEELRFEEAEEVKRKYLALDGFVSKSEVVSHTINNVDVFSITSDEKIAYINYIHVSNGCINQSFTIEYKKKLNESDEELLQLGIIELRERFKSDAKEIIVPQTGVNVMTAVAPHSLNIRPVVIPDSAKIELTVSSRSHTFLVAIDGRSGKLPEGTTLRLTRAPYIIKVVKRSSTHYFSTLREKLMWGADVR